MSLYPEKVPSTEPIRNFQFSIEAGLAAKAEIAAQIDNISERIDKIIDHFSVDDMPVIRFILNMTHDKETLKGLSKALDRIAELVEVHDNLTSKMKIIEHAEKDPSWFACTFGDFSSSFDNDLTDRLLGDDI